MRARPGVENEIDAVAQGADHVGRGRRGHVRMGVGAGRRERLAHGADQRERDGVLGCTHPDRRESPRDGIRHVRRAREHERERTGPERSRKEGGALGPRRGERLRHGLAVDVQDQGMSRGPLLGRKDEPHVTFVQTTRPQAVDGLGRERDEAPAREHGCSLGDHGRFRARGRYSEHAGHGPRG